MIVLLKGIKLVSGENVVVDRQGLKVVPVKPDLSKYVELLQGQLVFLNGLFAAYQVERSVRV